MPKPAVPNDIVRTTFIVLWIGLLMLATFWVLHPFLGSLIWSAMIVIASWPIFIKAQRCLRGKRSWAVIVMTLAQLLIIFVPLTLAIVALVENVGTISATANEIIQGGIPQPPSWLSSIPLIGSRLDSGWHRLSDISRDDLITKIGPYVGQALKWLLSNIGGVGSLLVQFILMAIISAILYAKGEVAANGVIRFARRLGGKRGEEVVILSGQAIRAVALGVVVTALVQTVMSAVGLLLAGVPHAMILIAVCFALSIVQVGVAPVVIGSSIYLYNNASTVAFVLYLIWGIVTLLSDNAVRPFLIKKGADLPLLLIFAGVIGGLISFGVIGLFVGPVVLAATYTLINAWIDEGDTSASSVG